MSLIYSKITRILNKINEDVRQSLFFSTIFKIIYFFEDAWVNSFFKSLYPGKDSLGFIKKNKILSEYIFHPFIVLLVFGIFLLLSLNNIGINLTITLIIAFLSFFIGYILTKFVLNNKEAKVTINFPQKDISSIGLFLILIGVLFFFVSIASVGGIPLLKPSIRYLLKPAFTMPVFLIIPGITLLGSTYIKRYQDNEISRSQVRFRFLVLILISSMFLLALGYRTPLLAVLLVMIIIGYYGDVIAVWEVVVGALLGVCLITGIGYYRSMEELTISSSTSPLYTLQSRADFTLNVLNLLNFISGNFGTTHGKMIASSIPGSELGPRMMVGKLISWRSEVTVTPTLIGQMVTDFGRLGVAIGMCLLGFILGIGFKIMKNTENYFYIGLYGLILTYAILGVETGILDIQVLFYYGIAIFIYLIYIVKSQKNKSITKN